MEDQLEPHLASAPMNSFLLELSRSTGKTPTQHLLPALVKALNRSTEYRCDVKQVLEQWNENGTHHDYKRVAAENVFEEIRKSLRTKKEKEVDNQLFTKYSMHSARAILKNEVANTAKFLAQEPVVVNLQKAWRAGHPFLKQWECMDQTTGEFKQECDLDLICEATEENPLDHRFFMRKDPVTGSLYTPVVKFVNQSNAKEVIIYGLNHTGPSAYFPEVLRKIRLDSDSQPKSVILREFFSCQTTLQVLERTVESITVEQGNYLNGLHDIYYPFNFLKKEALLQPLIDTYKLQNQSL